MHERNEQSEANDLLALTAAAREIFRSRNIFWRRYRRQKVPPPVITDPINLWSRNQLQRFRRGEIQRHPDTGIYYERDPQTLEWLPLPNQYVNTLPDARTPECC